MGQSTNSRRESSKNCSVPHTAEQYPGSPALKCKHSQEVIQSQIQQFGLKSGMVLTLGCLKRQQTGITQLSPAGKMVQLRWETTLGHQESYVPIHRTVGKCRGPEETTILQSFHKEDNLSFCPCLCLY